MLVCARLRHVAGTQWGTRHYMNMEQLSKLEDDLLSEKATAGGLAFVCDDRSGIFR